MSLVRGLKIRQALVLTSIVALFIVGVMSFYSYKIIKTYGTAINNVYEYPLQSTSMAERAKYNFQSVITDTLLLFETRDHDELLSLFDKIDESLISLKESMSVAALTSRSEESKEYVEKIAGVLKTFEEEIEVIKMEVEDSNIDKARKLFHHNRTKVVLDDALYKLADSELLYSMTLKENTKERGDEILSKMELFYYVSLLLLFILFYLFYLLAIRPLSVAALGCHEIISKHIGKSGMPETDDLKMTVDHLISEIMRGKEELRALMKNLPVGLFVFDRFGDIDEGYSSVAELILPELKSSKSIFNLFELFGATSKEEVQVALDIIWDKNRSIDFSDLVKSTLPLEVVKYSSNGEKKIVHLYYQEHRFKGELQGVIVHVYDDTESYQTHDNLERLFSQIHQITLAGQNIDSYYEFLNSINTSIERIENYLDSSIDDAAPFKRDIHALKELFRMYDFYDCVSMIHDLESFMNGNDILDTQAVTLKFETIVARFFHHKHTIAKALNLQDERLYTHVAIEKIDRLKEDIASKVSYDALKTAVEEFSCFPAERTLAKYKHYVTMISEKIGRPSVLNIDPSSSELTYREIRKIDATLGLILTNCVDHGIETYLQRSKFGKPEVGQIDIKIEKNGEFIQVTVRDDGQGIDSETLAKKAVDKGIWTHEQALEADEVEKLMLIFEPSLSTKTDVEVFSGRGVGMDAAIEEISDLGGEITVDSKLNEGTTFSFFYRY